VIGGFRKDGADAASRTDEVARAESQKETPEHARANQSHGQANREIVAQVASGAAPWAA
jgi:hypothetical protein